ncbi:bacteriophage abortive infection AbiH family protein, partial [Alloprevotella tannerae]|uniref:bacteriophage abortive infection AbiH family protein n=1 Tax=Alloprevotella tannerae TaxID=76122 RepID=UPI0028E91A0C
MNQESLFPTIDVENKHTLFIIGNGFDIAHRLKTQYCDFEEWLRQQGNDHLVRMIETFFSNYRDFWGDIEKALGEYDEEEIVDWCSPDEGIDYEHPTRSVAAIEDGPDWLFKPILDEFLEAFNQWVESIDINEAIVMFSLPAESHYLTFNYTETLEKLYGIPQENILHIHGSRLKHDDYIIGHNQKRDPNDAYEDETELLFKQDTWSKVIAWMNELVKDTNGIIKHNQAFFNSLGDITKVVVIGHSFYPVDYPYMIEVVQQTGTTVLWTISYHTQNDIERPLHNKAVYYVTYPIVY